MTFEQAKARLLQIEAEVVSAEDALKAFPKDGPFGLTSDIVRAKPEWKAAKARFQKAFKALQDFNVEFTKVFRKELRAERDARRSTRNT